MVVIRALKLTKVMGNPKSQVFNMLPRTRPPWDNSAIPKAAFRTNNSVADPSRHSCDGEMEFLKRVELTMKVRNDWEQ